MYSDIWNYKRANNLASLPKDATILLSTPHKNTNHSCKKNCEPPAVCFLRIIVTYFFIIYNIQNAPLIKNTAI